MLNSIMSSTWWLTPTKLFLLLNLVIGTIAITSRYSSRRKPGRHQQQQQLGRVPAMIDRVKSINFPQYKFPSTNLDDGSDHHLRPPTMEPDYGGNANSPPQLARVGSFLGRVKSVNFYRFKFQSYNLDTESEFVESEDENRVDSSFHISNSGDRSIHKESDQDESSDLGYRVQANPTPQLARVPSFLDRVKSINFPRYKFPSNNLDTEFLEPEHENLVDPDENSDLGHRVHVQRTKLEHNETRSKRVLPGKMKKSASEKFGYGSKSDVDIENVERRRPQTAREEKTAPFNGDVDAKADDFINKFKQQLKLQRIDSLLSYRGK